jgi:Flagellar hook-length control protein FliK
LPPLRAAAAPDAGALVGDPSDSIGDTAPGLPHLPDLPVHRDTLNVLRHQLDTLDTRQVVWNGLIWPDQPIEWEITGQEPSTPDMPEEQPWRTRLRLTLPRLGAIDATLIIAARGVKITLHAASGDAAQMLADHQGELQQALRGAGVTPFSITVGRDETA